MTRVGPAGAPSSTAEGNTAKLWTNESRKARREPRHEQRQEHVAEAPPGPRAVRRRGVLERRVDARHIAQHQEEREGEGGDEERHEHAPVIVRQPHRPVRQVEEHQAAREPALRPEIVEQALRDEHRPERDRQDEQRGEQPLASQQPDPERDRHREQQADDAHRQRELQRGPDRAVLERVGEERDIAREQAAGLRREAQPEPVEERINEAQER